jgi:hypothetical protein
MAIGAAGAHVKREGGDNSQDTSIFDNGEVPGYVSSRISRPRLSKAYSRFVSACQPSWGRGYADFGDLDVRLIVVEEMDRVRPVWGTIDVHNAVSAIELQFNRPFGSSRRRGKHGRQLALRRSTFLRNVRVDVRECIASIAGKK